MRKLKRNTNSRKALIRSLIRALVKEDRITTTRAKAKMIQPVIDKIMGKISDGSLSARRSVLATLGNDRETTDMLFSDKFVKLSRARKSGYTSITLLPKRRGDNSQAVGIEFVKNDEDISTKSKGN